MDQPSIVVSVSTQRDGYVFGLKPRSRVWLESRYPNKQRVLSVFIGLDKVLDWQQIPDSILEQVLKLLTGLSSDEIAHIGGFSIYNPVTGQELPNPSQMHV